MTHTSESGFLSDTSQPKSRLLTVLFHFLVLHICFWQSLKAVRISTDSKAFQPFRITVTYFYYSTTAALTLGANH